MRMVLLAAISCMLIGSLNGMKNNELILLDDMPEYSGGYREHCKTIGKHVADFAHGYAMGTAAGISLASVVFCAVDDNTARKVVTLPLSFAASSVTLFKAITATRMICGEEPWQWSRGAYILGGASAIVSTPYLFIFAMVNGVEQCDSTNSIF